MRNTLSLLCSLLLTACSAEVAVDTPPMSQAIPITSVFEPAYVEVAVDMPEETQRLDVIVKSLTADLTMVNPSRSFTLETSIRLSLTGTATPDAPKFYNRNNLPPYYATSEELLPTSTFAPNSRTPVTINSPTLVKTLGKQRIWLFVSNTVKDATVGGTLPLEIQLENVILHAVISKPFHGLEGVLGPGGL